jgi:hypothetical protein
MSGGRRAVLDGWRYGVFVSAVFGAVGLAIYPVIISPWLNPEPWRQKCDQVRGV